MDRSIHIALVAGPMYEPLYEHLQTFATEQNVEVKVGFLGDHPSLNAHLASVAI